MHTHAISHIQIFTYTQNTHKLPHTHTLYIHTHTSAHLWTLTRHHMCLVAYIKKHAGTFSVAVYTMFWHRVNKNPPVTVKNATCPSNRSNRIDFRQHTHTHCTDIIVHRNIRWRENPLAGVWLHTHSHMVELHTRSTLVSEGWLSVVVQGSNSLHRWANITIIFRVAFRNDTRHASDDTRSAPIVIPPSHLLLDAMAH